MKTPLYIFFIVQLCWTVLICIQSLNAQDQNQDNILDADFRWTGSWESEGNLSNRFDLRLNIPKADVALRMQVLDRRPASEFELFTESFGGETKDKVITQPGLGLYHQETGSRLLYGTLETHGLIARTRNIWIRGVPYAESRTASSADLRTTVSSAAIPQFYTFLETPNLTLGQGNILGFASFLFNNDFFIDGLINNEEQQSARSFGAGVNYSQGKAKIRLETLYGERTLPERRSTTWFNQRHPLPERNTRLFAGAMNFSVPAFGLAVDLAYSETFAFGDDYYGSLGIRFGDRPWRLSMALDAAGSHYVDSQGNIPGIGLRAGARLERRGKRTGLFRISALARGPGLDMDSMNRFSGDLYYRFPTSTAVFKLTRFSFSLERDGRNENNVLDSARAMMAFAIGPLSYTSEGRIRSDDSYRLVQSLSWTIQGSGSALAKTAPIPGTRSSGTGTSFTQRFPFTVQLSARAVYEKNSGKDGDWSASFAASIRGKRGRLTIRTAGSGLNEGFDEQWEHTISWSLLF